MLPVVIGVPRRLLLVSRIARRAKGDTRMQSPNLGRPAQIQLHRSRTNRMIAGVCGGIAESLGVDPMVVRLVTLILLVPFSAMVLVLYVVLALLLPEHD
jgi:phage shock protein PspC (stress-responsive transcriptional regulator)